ncbi:MAG: lysophospholipase [Solirubrobacterales bacterium]|nr:lysophospholipase [Solirubrobacterales bacterium]
MIRRSGRFAGTRGGEIFWRSWAPDADAARGVVVIAHGVGEHSGRYEHIAECLTDAAFAVFALDHRGHGRSDGPRARLEIDDAVADVDRLVTMAAAAHPRVRRFLLGHSLGGAIAVQYALAHQDRLAGLVLSGPFAAIEASAALRSIGRLLSALAPGAPLIGVDPTLVCRDPDVVRAYRADPLVHHGRLPARTLARAADAIERFPERVGQIEVPTLILYGMSDRVVPPAGSRMLAARIGASDLTIHGYPGFYHEVLAEPERDAVLRDVGDWLRERS